MARSLNNVLDTPYDYVIVTTKAIPEMKRTPEILEPLLSKRYKYPQPTYVLLQNGLNVEKDLHAELLKRSEQPLIISCALYIMTNIVANGEVIHGAFVGATLKGNKGIDGCILGRYPCRHISSRGRRNHRKHSKGADYAGPMG